jgi:hypothetical protein
MYKRKTQDEYILLGNYGYGHGYEELTAESSRIEIRQRLKEYKENDSYALDFKIIKKRVKIETNEVT